MPLYLYAQPSVLDRVTVIKTEKGGYRGYLHLSPGISPTASQKIRHTLDGKGWQTIPIIFNGQPMLEVRAFKHENQLINVLNDNQWINNNFRKLPAPGDILSARDIIAERSLQGSGLAYIASDISFILYGMKNASTFDMIGGWSYLLGTLALVGYGRNDNSSRDIKELSQEMVSYLQKHNHVIPKDSALARLAEHKDKTLIGKFDDFLSRYPAETWSALTFIAGACIATASVKHKFPHADNSWKKLSAWLDVGLGSMTMASTSIGMFVTEKHPDPDAPPPKNELEKLLLWVQERPLRIMGYGLMMSTICHLFSTAIDYKLAKSGLERDKIIKGIPYRAAFVALSLTAEFLMSISSKGHGEGVETDKSVENSMISIAAEMISRESPELHEYLIQHMTKFLGDPSALGSKNINVERELREAVHHINKNPWANRHDQPEYVPEPSQSATRQSQLKPESKINAPTKAQQRLSMPSQAASVPVS